MYKGSINIYYKHKSTCKKIKSDANNSIIRFYNHESNPHRVFLDNVARDAQFKEMSDWYNIANVKHKIDDLLPQYGNHPYNLLSSLYPEYNWLPWKFPNLPRRFWQDPTNQRKFMNWAGNELKIKDINDWYKVEFRDLRRLGGGTLLDMHNNSVIQLLSAVYPENPWIPWKFNNSPIGFWTSVENQRKFMDSAGKELGIKDMSDWYQVTQKDIEKVGGKSMLKHKYGNSTYKLLSSIYPEYEWLPWKFHKNPIHCWNKDTTIKYIHMISKDLNIEHKEDWYKINHENIRSLEGGSGLLRAFNNSLYQILVQVYPEYDWLPWRFDLDYWTDIKDSTMLVEWMGKKLGIKEMNDWYNVNIEKLIDLGGACLLMQHHTLFHLLSHIYPKHTWEQNRFPETDIWTDSKKVKYLIEHLQTTKEEIPFVNRVIKKIKQKGNPPLIQHLSNSFVEYDWKTSASEHMKKSQYILKECLKKLFPEEVLEEYKHPDMYYLELDYYYPMHKLAFEYQGQQHYRKSTIFHQSEPLDLHKNRDKNKREICQQLGITLIEVPYWWDRSVSSLASTVYTLRPELFKEKPIGNPISMNPPSPTDLKKNKNQMFMTATEWDDTTDPTGWYMTEKYDGMRLYWNGSQFFSRQGLVVKVPKSLTSQLPSVPLDGELWTRYGLYQEAANLPKSSNEDKWQKAIYWIFDAPTNNPLESRVEKLKQMKLPSFAKVVDFVKCEGKEHLKQFYQEVLVKGGEGVVLREPGSMYKVGRSFSLRKYKPFLDAEVKVVKNQYPHGFSCENPNGTTLFVKIIENDEEAKKVKIGDVITVKHTGVNVYGSLLYPQFYRKRLDLNWSDIVNKTS